MCYVEEGGCIEGGGGAPVDWADSMVVVKVVATAVHWVAWKVGRRVAGKVASTAVAMVGWMVLRWVVGWVCSRVGWRVAERGAWRVGTRVVEMAWSTAGERAVRRRRFITAGVS